MDADPIALLHQLAANPTMVQQLQSVLSMLQDSHDRSVLPSSPGHTNAVGAATHKPSPHAVSSPYVALSGTQSLPSELPSRPQASAGTKNTVTSRSPQAKAGGGPKNWIENAPVSGTEVGKGELQLREQVGMSEQQRKETTRAAALANQRTRELERQIASMSHKVDHLTSVIQDQRKQLQTMEERHQLEVAEMKNSYALALQRRDDIHEEALRRVIKSGQLLAAAKEYDCVIKSATGLSTTTKPVNVRHALQSQQRSSGAKRNRASSEGDEDGAIGGPDALSLTRTRKYSNAGSNSTVKSRRIPQWSEPSECMDGAVKEDHEVPIPSTAPGHNARGRGKVSTVLTAGTTAPSRSKRRTPRTPSLTHAERLDHGYPLAFYPPPNSASMASPHPVTNTATTARGVAMSHTGGQKLHHMATSREVDMRSSTLSPPSVAADRLPRGPQVVVPTPTSQHDGQNPGVNLAKAAEQGPSELPLARPPPASHGPVVSRPPLTKVTGQLSQRRPPTPGGGLSLTAGGAVRSGTSSVVGGPTRSPSPVNPKRGPSMVRRFIFTGLKDEEPERLQHAIQQLGDQASVLTCEFDEPPPLDATHIVVRGTPRSVKALCGVVSAKWLVAPEYVYDSLQAGFWLDEFAEGGLRITRLPLQHQRFLLTVTNAGLRQKLAEVIEYGGGEVVRGSSSMQTGNHAAAAHGVIVIASGDDLLRYATQAQ